MMLRPDLQTGKAVEASTVGSPGKVRAAHAVIYYDQNCALCRHLAQLISRKADEHGLTLLASIDPAPEELVVQADGATFTGREAWSWLIEHHSIFREWNWLATKLGWHDEAVTFVMRGADVLRRMCPGCRKSARR